MNICRVSNDLQGFDSPVNEQNEVPQDFKLFYELIESCPKYYCNMNDDAIEVNRNVQGCIVELIFTDDSDCIAIIEGEKYDCDFLHGYESFDLTDEPEDICFMVLSMIEFVYTHSYQNER